jgi:hemoglobin
MNLKIPRLLLGLALAMAAPLCLAQTTTPAPEPTTTSEDDLDISEATPAPEAPAAVTEAPAGDPSAGNPAPADASLLPVYKQFGELDGLKALMDEFMIQLLKDERTRPFFAEADQTAIKAHLVEQFCVILGGPCTYSGRDMKTTHAGLGIERSQFNALVEDLQIAMAKRGIPFRAQNKLLAKLAPMHRDIESKTASE